MSSQHMTGEVVISMTPSQRKTEAQYLQKERRSIERSKQILRLEEERLEQDRYDLSQHLYQEVKQDLVVMAQELDCRERSLEVRQRNYEAETLTPDEMGLPTSCYVFAMSITPVAIVASTIIALIV